MEGEGARWFEPGHSVCFQSSAPIHTPVRTEAGLPAMPCSYALQLCPHALVSRPSCVGRRTTGGLSKKDILRCLKRYIAREALPNVTS